jgi:hypothetical protein
MGFSLPRGRVSVSEKAKTSAKPNRLCPFFTPSQTAKLLQLVADHCNWLQLIAGRETRWLKLNT